MTTAPAMPRKANGTSSGFTLIELAVVIAIVGLLLGAMLTPLSLQIRNKRILETEVALETIKEALIGFAMSQGRLPCPDNLTDAIPFTNLDGLEDGDGTNGCESGEVAGVLPWQTLGVGSTDAWGRLLYYRVTAEFTRTVSTGASCAANQLDLCDAGDMTVFTRGDDPSTGAVTEAKFQIGYVSDAPAVIASMGGNGYGGRQADNPTVLITYPAEYPVVGLADDERDNSSVAANANFVARIHSLSGTAACDDTPTEGVAFCEFDDIVTWLSTSVLLNRLVTSGQLP